MRHIWHYIEKENCGGFHVRFVVFAETPWSRSQVCTTGWRRSSTRWWWDPTSPCSTWSSSSGSERWKPRSARWVPPTAAGAEINTRVQPCTWQGDVTLHLTKQATMHCWAGQPWNTALYHSARRPTGRDVVQCRRRAATEGLLHNRRHPGVHWNCHTALWGVSRSS